MLAKVPTITIDQSSLADQAYEKLKILILSGVLKGGERIQEEQLAHQFGVSRTPIREALRRLSEYGLITSKARSAGIVVEITGKESRHISEVRLSLETLAIRRLDANCIPTLIEKTSKVTAEYQLLLSQGEVGQAYEKDSDFHNAIIEAANNPVLTEIYKRLDARIQLIRVTQNLSADALYIYSAQHMQMVQMLKNGDFSGVATLLETHIMHDIPD